MRILLVLVAFACVVAAADVQEDAAANELKKFQGTWVLTAGEMDGQKIAEEHVKKGKLTWKGKDVVIETPHQSKETIRAVSTLNPAKKPKEMDWVRLAGPQAGKSFHAIYEFMADDQYRVCFDPSGKNRPNEFATKPGTGYILHVWKRAKE